MKKRSEGELRKTSPEKNEGVFKKEKHGRQTWRVSI